MGLKERKQIKNGVYEDGLNNYSLVDELKNK
jgi:hypothetical protein